MADLTNPRLICAKGFLFLLAGLLSASLLVLAMPTWRNVMLLCMTVWCFCRGYYFAFYVIEHYVDDNYRFAGLFDFVKYCVHCRGKSLDERAADGAAAGPTTWR